jgi:uncharacterized membrane-anchored protein YhcB (DUF1043 family)
MFVVVLGTVLLIIFILVIVFRERNHALTRQVEATEKKMDATEQALKDFTAAIAEYAKHLSSHTGAIQGLAEASQELKKSAAFQNNVILDLIKNTEDAIVRREALLKTVKLDIAPPASPPKKPVKPAWEKAPVSYRAAHPVPEPRPAPEGPAPGPGKTVFEAANLVQAMVLPYYRALYKLENENPAPADEPTKARAKKAVEAIMYPFYRTLYKVEPEKDAKEKPAKNKPAKPDNPYYSRRRHPLKPW